MSTRLIRKGLLAALASGTLLVAGCATETTYRPASGSGFYRTGYSDRQIEPNRFLVSFAGNSVTPRDTVERYLFFRSAELTLQQGYDYYVMVQRDTDRQTRTYTTPGFGGGFGGGPWGYGGFGGYWGPSWRYYGRGWGGWSPWYGGGWGAWGNNFDIQQVDRFEATAEVVMRKGPIPRGDIRAFDAHKVVETIGPTIVLPGQEKR